MSRFPSLSAALQSYYGEDGTLSKLPPFPFDIEGAVETISDIDGPVDGRLYLSRVEGEDGFTGWGGVTIYYDPYIELIEVRDDTPGFGNSLFFVGVGGPALALLHPRP